MAKKTHKSDSKNIKTSVTPAPAVPSAAPAPRKAVELRVLIDYPLQDEGITSGEYTFRIATQPSAEKVEVSIDRGPWLSARSASGFWWYDWSNFTEGVHRITARALTGGGTSGISQQRRIQVIKK